MEFTEAIKTIADLGLVGALLLFVWLFATGRVVSAEQLERQRQQHEAENARLLDKIDAIITNVTASQERVVSGLDSVAREFRELREYISVSLARMEERRRDEELP